MKKSFKFIYFLSIGFSTVQAQILSQHELVGLSLDNLMSVEVVSSSKTLETTELAAATIYLITAEQIQKLGLRDLKDVLAIVPGVDISDNHLFLQGGQRGFMGPFSQSLLLINGREMNNLIAGETFISNQFRTHNVKQIEVIAGPASALYGANAVGGMINIITKTPVDVDGAQIGLSFSEDNTQVFDITFGQEKNGWKIGGALSYYRTDGEDFSDFLSNTQLASPLAENNAYRHLPNQYGYDDDAMALPISLYVEKQGFYFGSDYYQNRTGRGTASIQWDYNNSEDYRELWLKYVGYQTDNLLDGKMGLRLEYRHYWERFWGNHTESTGALENPLTGETLTETATLTDVEAFRGYYSNKRSRGSRKHVALVESTYRLDKGHSLLMGISHEQSDVMSAAWSRTDGEHPSLNESNHLPEFKNYKTEGYTQYERRFLQDQLSLTLGARFVTHERYDNKFLPRIGVVYQPNKETVLKLLYGKAFREPLVFELSNNTAIQPMEVDSYELGWHQYFLNRSLKNEAVIFFNEATDLIVSDDVIAIANRGQLRSQGFEDVFHFQYKEVIGFLNYTYMNTVETEERGITTEVYDIPSHKVNLALTYALTADTSLGVIGRYRSKVDTAYQDQIYTINDYTVWDLTLRTERLTAWLGQNASLAISAKNVFDKTYYHPEPRDANALQHLQEGRSLWLHLEFAW